MAKKITNKKINQQNKKAKARLAEEESKRLNQYNELEKKKEKLDKKLNPLQSAKAETEEALSNAKKLKAEKGAEITDLTKNLEEFITKNQEAKSKLEGKIANSSSQLAESQKSMEENSASAQNHYKNYKKLRDEYNKLASEKPPKDLKAKDEIQKWREDHAVKQNALYEQMQNAFKDREIAAKAFSEAKTSMKHHTKNLKEQESELKKSNELYPKELKKAQDTLKTHGKKLNQEILLLDKESAKLNTNLTKLTEKITPLSAKRNNIIRLQEKSHPSLHEQRQKKAPTEAEVNIQTPPRQGERTAATANRTNPTQPARPTQQNANQPSQPRPGGREAAAAARQPQQPRPPYYAPPPPYTQNPQQGQQQSYGRPSQQAQNTYYNPYFEPKFRQQQQAFQEIAQAFVQLSEQMLQNPEAGMQHITQFANRVTAAQQPLQQQQNVGYEQNISSQRNASYSGPAVGSGPLPRSEIPTQQTATSYSRSSVDIPQTAAAPSQPSTAQSEPIPKAEENVTPAVSHTIPSQPSLEIRHPKLKALVETEKNAFSQQNILSEAVHRSILVTDQIKQRTENELGKPKYQEPLQEYQASLDAWEKETRGAVEKKLAEDPQYTRNMKDVKRGEALAEQCYRATQDVKTFVTSELSNFIDTHKGSTVNTKEEYNKAQKDFYKIEDIAAYAKGKDAYIELVGETPTSGYNIDSIPSQIDPIAAKLAKYEQEHGITAQDKEKLRAEAMQELNEASKTGPQQEPAKGVEKSQKEREKEAFNKERDLRDDKLKLRYEIDKKEGEVKGLDTDLVRSPGHEGLLEGKETVTEEVVRLKAELEKVKQDLKEAKQQRKQPEGAEKEGQQSKQESTAKPAPEVKPEQKPTATAEQTSGEKPGTTPEAPRHPWQRATPTALKQDPAVAATETRQPQQPQTPEAPEPPQSALAAKLQEQIKKLKPVTAVQAEPQQQDQAVGAGVSGPQPGQTETQAAVQSTQQETASPRQGQGVSNDGGYLDIDNYVSTQQSEAVATTLQQGQSEQKPKVVEQNQDQAVPGTGSKAPAFAQYMQEGQKDNIDSVASKQEQQKASSPDSVFPAEIPAKLSEEESKELAKGAKALKEDFTQPPPAMPVHQTETVAVPSQEQTKNPEEIANSPGTGEKKISVTPTATEILEQQQDNRTAVPSNVAHAVTDGIVQSVGINSGAPKNIRTGQNGGSQNVSPPLNTPKPGQGVQQTVEQGGKAPVNSKRLLSQSSENENTTTTQPPSFVKKSSFTRN